MTPSNWTARSRIFATFLFLLLVAGCGGGGGGSDEEARACNAALKLLGSGAMTRPDFNGDGCEDLAVGTPFKEAPTALAGLNHGGVIIIHGTPDGLRGAASQGWTRGGGIDINGNLLGDIPGTPNNNDYFGYSLAWGDFNADGFSDLAIGIPNDDSDPGTPDSGAVQVLYGTVNGLRATNNQYINQGGVWTDPEGDGTGNLDGDIIGSLEPGDQLGWALAAGDFNNDGYYDLAVGATSEDIDGEDAAGSVNVVYGSPTGLSWRHNEFLSGDDVQRNIDGVRTNPLSDDLVGAAEADDRLGSALAAGDINGDGYDDLLIGAYGEAVGAGSSEGAFHVVPGSANGLTSVGSQHAHQEAIYTTTLGDGVIQRNEGSPFGTPENNDNFGWSLTVGDFNNDGFDDVATGIPGEDVSQGAVQVFYGSNSFLTLFLEDFIEISRIRFYQDEVQIGSTVWNGPPAANTNVFGDALTAGDFNGDGIDDLAIGANDPSNVSPTTRGSVTVLFGATQGLVTEGLLRASPDGVQDFNGTLLGGVVANAVEADDFGRSLSNADFNDDGFDDLAIGIPRFGLTTVPTVSGAVGVTPGGSSGLQITGSQFWTQDGGVDDQGNSLGDLPSTSASGDQFGKVLP